MTPRRDRWTIRAGFLLPLVCLMLFFAGGAVLAWRSAVVEPLTLLNLPVLKVAGAMADLGWSFWGR